MSNAAWARALSLAERIDLYRENPDSPAVDGELSQRRYEAWEKSLELAGEASVLGERLEQSGIDEQEFRAVLGIDPRDLIEPGAGVPWDHGFERWSSDSLGGRYQAELYGVLEASQLGLFEHFSARAVEGAVVAVIGRCTGLSIDGDLSGLVISAARSLAIRLDLFCERALLLELNGMRILNQLPGETTEHRFAAFLDIMITPDFVSSFFDTYPVLARRVGQAIQLWIKATEGLLVRLGIDWPDVLRSLGAPNDVGPLVGIEMGAGDAHAGGQTVTTLTTASGWRTIYKPRPIQIERTFHDLLGLLHDWGGALPARTWRIHDAGAYGYVEFVQAVDVPGKVEAERHYDRLGTLLALLYVVGGTDVHRENLIAHGEHPVLIDMETLLAPEPSRVGISDAPFLERIGDSVLRTLLLPTGKSSESFDQSGVGDGATPQFVDVPVLIDNGSDTARLDMAPYELPREKNVLEVDGVPMRAVDFLPNIVAGFTAAYGCMVEHRVELADPDGPLRPLRETPMRVVLRDTMAYSLLLRGTHHPQLLGEALARDRHLDQVWVGTRLADYVRRVAGKEIEDLIDQDIPFFSNHPESTAVQTPDGTVIEGVLQTSGWDRTLARLARLGAEDLREQLFIISASFAASAEDTSHRLDPSLTPILAGPTGKVVDVSAEATGADLHEIAGSIADWLDSTAVIMADQARWYGLQDGPSGSYVALLAADLYSGLGGISLFLAERMRLTGVRATALAPAVRSFEELIDDSGHLTKGVGGYTGWGALLWSANRLDELGHFDLGSRLDNWLEHARAGLGEDDWFDITHGSAGLGCGLLAVASRYEASDALELAVEAAEHIEHHAVALGQGIGWATTAPSASEAEPALSGMAHGNAGIAMFMGRVGAATGDPRWWAVAEAALRYERTLFDEEQQNWPDLRLLVGEDQREYPKLYQATWCYGAPGILASRVDLLKSADHHASIVPAALVEQLRADARIAALTTRRLGFGPAQGLCHGSVGNLVMLADAARYLDDPELLGVVHEHRTAIALTLAAGEISLASRVGIIGPGLMTGLSGVGLGLLELADPDSTPSVLTLSS